MMRIKRIVLIEPKAPSIHFFKHSKLPRLGLPLLGAILKKLGYSVKIFCEDIAPLNWRKVLEADLIGISTITATATRAYHLIKTVKELAGQVKKSIPIVIGGPHVTFLPEEALACGADYVVRGEGERTLTEIVEFLEGNGSIEKIQGLSYRVGEEIRHNPNRPLLSNCELDSLPFPDLTLIEGFERINYTPIQTSRGCPYNCKFCAVIKMFGRGFRHFSNEYVMEELKDLYRQRPKSPIFFYDDNFSANPQRTKSLLEEMIQRKLTPPAWIGQEMVKVAEKEDLLKLMRQSRCGYLCLGLESVNPQTLKNYRKSQKVEDIELALEKFHRYKIKVHGMFVFGGESDEVSTIRETVKFSLRKRIDTVQYSILTPLPGTDTYKELEEDGRIFIKGADNWELYDGHHVVYQPKLMSPWQLQMAVVEAMSKFYSMWQGIKLAASGRFANSFFAFHGRRLIKKWGEQNREFMEWLRKTTVLNKETLS
jgi:radical SAM superfamily enzyme YgiQ (UPF0313 family)